MSEPPNEKTLVCTSISRMGGALLTSRPILRKLAVTVPSLFTFGLVGEEVERQALQAELTSAVLFP